MLPADTFPQSNTLFAATAEPAARPLKAYCGAIAGGPLKGTKVAVTAWRPTTEELLRLNAGGSLYVSTLGGLAAHYVTVDFHEATHPQ